jgi:hypothetical protein
MTVPADLARLLVGRPDVGVAEQAFPFLTVDEAGSRTSRCYPGPKSM